MIIGLCSTTNLDFDNEAHGKERTMKTRMTSWLSLVISLVSIALFASCGGGGGGGGGPTGPQFANIRGAHEGGWTIVLQEASTGATETFICPGSVTVTSQSGSGFSGTFAIRSTVDCEPVFGTFTGTLRSDGGITVVVGDGPGGIEDLIGCIVISGDSSFAGSVQGSQMSHVTAVTDCDLDGQTVRITWTITFNGTRQ
jgi:hypothetical protein